jgi:DNA-binding NarL/FixJ family response regulator
MIEAVGLVASEPPIAERIREVLEGEEIDLAFSTISADGEVALPRGHRGTVIVAAPLRSRDGSLLARAREAMPAASLLGCTPPSDARALRWALDNGIEGLVWDTEIEVMLPIAVRAIAAGLLVVPRELRRRLQPPELTTREKQILSLVVMGFSNGEIAGKLYVTESTVKSHLGTAFRKLGVRSRAEASRMITDPDEGLGMGILAITESGLRPRSSYGA